MCETKVVEFMVASEPVMLQLVVDGKAIIDTEYIGWDRITIQTVDKEGHPVPSVAVLVRDEEALHEKWYKTGPSGTVEVELPPDVPVVFVSLNEGKLTTKTLDRKERDQVIAGGRRLTIPLD